MSLNQEMPSQALGAIGWLACLFIPPLGFYYVWKKRSRFSKSHVVTSLCLATLSMFLFPCTGLGILILVYIFGPNTDWEPQVELQNNTTISSMKQQDSYLGESTIQTKQSGVIDARPLVDTTVESTGGGSFAEARLSYLESFDSRSVQNMRDVVYFFTGDTDMITGFKNVPEDERDAREGVLIFTADVRLPSQPSLRGKQQFTVSFRKAGAGWQVTRKQIYFGDTWINLSGDATELVPSGMYPK